MGTTGNLFRAMCESYYHDDMTPEELEDAVANTLVSGLNRDILSGWGGIVYILTEDKLVAKYVKTKML